MAVPDPHMIELTIMSYEPRHRACKDLYKVPRRCDYIEVLWCLDYLPGMPNRWCPAEVLHVSGSTEKDYLARGVIRYIPSDTWEEKFDFVEFLERNQLRCSANFNEEEREQVSDYDKGKNDNPSLDWRFRTEHAEHADTDSDDDVWCADASQDAGSQRNTTLNRVRTEGVIGSHNEVEVKALRHGHAYLTVEVEKLKRAFAEVSRHIASLQRTDNRHPKCTSAVCVLPRIRQKLALKMKASVRHAPVRKRKRDDPDQDLSIGYVDGVHPGVIRARVECTLQQFESLSRHVRTNSSPNVVFFFPEFSFTQLPLQCSSEFPVFIKTFSHLSDIIGIASSSDKMEMARKCGKGPQGELLRSPVTYCYDENDEHSPAHFFPGSSRAVSPPQRIAHMCSDAQSTDATNDKADPLFPVLARRTREWNRVDGRFKHSLRRDSFPLPALAESCSDMNAFTIVWKRAAELAGKAWSQALSESGEVFGWLEICIPFVQTQGKQRCQELGGIGNDDMWDELLRGDSE